MKCPNCSGRLYYDISKHVLKCEYCNETFEVNEYKVNNDAQEDLVEGIRIYTCKNCGAKLISTNDEAVSYCNYCDSQAVLDTNISGMKRPKKVIPFRISKRDCKQIYLKELKNKLYVPKEFKDLEFIERFRPFYIPYWMYSIKMNREPFDLKGRKTYTRGGYDYIEDYDVTVQIDEEGIYGLPYDASRNFDDTLAEEIAPFNKKDLIDFKEGYLAGMYADSPNVDASIYEEDVNRRSKKLVTNELNSSISGMYLKLPSGRKLDKLIGMRNESQDTILLPVWFLTWRKNDRVAYAIVNGQTGKIHVDLPVDINNFLLYTSVLAMIIFALLSLFVTVTSRFVIWFSAMLLHLISRKYLTELRKIRNRENHVFDKGYLLSDGEKLPMSEAGRKRARFFDSIRNSNLNRGFKVAIGCLVFTLMFVMFGAMYDELVSQEGAIALTFLILFLQCFTVFKTIGVSLGMRNKWSLLISLLSLLAVGYAFAVASIEPVEDWWYYLGSLACLAAASIICGDLIIRYNEITTRPLPSFYDRNGGHDRNE